LNAEVTRAESASRGYILGGNADFRESFAAALPAIDSTLAALRQRIRDPRARELLKALEPAVSLKVQFMQELVELRARGQASSAHALFETDRGVVLMDGVHANTEALIDREEQLLTERQADLLRRQRVQGAYMWIFAAVMTAGVALMAFLAIRVARLQSLVKVCAWSRTVEHDGEWITMEEYLRRRFNLDITHGISPQEKEKFAALRNTQAQKRAA
jgi:CHASE3 domain sensor protein